MNFRQESLSRINQCNKIINEYAEEGLHLTLRQLYYQLVTQNIIPNLEKSYKDLSSLVSNGRLAGLIDWNAIEDRTRMPRMHSEFENLNELVQAATYSYRLPRWDGQNNYVELWVEKDALAGVLSPLANEFHVVLMVNRGYSSQTAMYEASRRFLASNRDPVLFYLGDFDPSGEDMVRDIRDRMEMFGVNDLDVQKLALTMEQIETYNPPPNPAKVSDPRAVKYIEEHGDSSWEVDALPPRVLNQIISGAFANIIDDDLLNEIKEKEQSDIKRLRAAASKIAKS
jgi:hypothetical protein